MEVNGSGDDNVMQDKDWVRLGASTAGMDFDTYMSVDQELGTCGVLRMEEMCGAVRSGSCMKEGQGDGGDEAKSTPVQRFTEALHAFESMTVFMYGHNITKIEQANIVNTERLLFSLKMKGATKQIRINYLFLKEVKQIGLESGNNITGVHFLI
jgi:hypothetical protein